MAIMFSPSSIPLLSSFCFTLLTILKTSEQKPFFFKSKTTETLLENEDLLQSVKVLSLLLVGQISNFNIFLSVYVAFGKLGTILFSTNIYVKILQFLGIFCSLQDEKLSLHFLIFQCSK